MRIAFAVSNKEGLDSLLSGHFGRCPYYIFVEVEDKKIKAVEGKDNPFYHSHQPGQIPQFIKEEKAEVIIAGGMGRRAVEFFQEFGIKPITAPLAKVKELLEKYLAGELSGWQNCTESENHHHSHHHNT